MDDGEMANFNMYCANVRSDLDQSLFGYSVWGYLWHLLRTTLLGVFDGYSLSKIYTPAYIGGPQSHSVCMDYATECYSMLWGQDGMYHVYYCLGDFKMSQDAYDTYMRKRTLASGLNLPEECHETSPSIYWPGNLAWYDQLPNTVCA